MSGQNNRFDWKQSFSSSTSKTANPVWAFDQNEEHVCSPSWLGESLIPLARSNWAKCLKRVFNFSFRKKGKMSTLWWIHCDPVRGQRVSHQPFFGTRLKWTPAGNTNNGTNPLFGCVCGRTEPAFQKRNELQHGVSFWPGTRTIALEGQRQNASFPTNERSMRNSPFTKHLGHRSVIHALRSSCRSGDDAFLILLEDGSPWSNFKQTYPFQSSYPWHVEERKW